MDKKKKKSIVIAVVCIIIAICAVGGAYYLGTNQSYQSDPGVSVQSYDGMTDEEIQKELNRKTEESRMTLSVSPNPILKDGKVRVNLINDKDNKFSQSFILEQNGKTIYESGLVKPGETLEWAEAKDAKTGEATITIQAHDKDSGRKTGNPQSVTVNIE